MPRLRQILSQTPQEVNTQIVAVYTRSEPISKIIEATGSTAIYTALRKEGIRPSRHARNDLLAPLVKASGGSYPTTTDTPNGGATNLQIVHRRFELDLLGGANATTFEPLVWVNRLTRSLS